jgi:hypothetical protein
VGSATNTAIAEYAGAARASRRNDRAALPNPTVLSEHIAPVVRSVIAAQTGAA